MGTELQNEVSLFEQAFAKKMASTSGLKFWGGVL